MLDGRPDPNSVPEASHAAAPAVHAPLAVPRPLPERGAWIGALVAAVIGHGAVAAVLWPTPDARIGGAGDRLEAIAVEIVPAVALAGGEAGVPAEAAVASAPVQTGSLQDPATETMDRQPEPMAELAAVREAPPVEAETVLDRPETVPRPDAAVESPVEPMLEAIRNDVQSKPEPIAEPVAEAAMLTKPPEAVPAAHQLSMPPREAGMAAAASQAASVSSGVVGAGAAQVQAASPGALQAFGREVARLLQGSPPKPVKGRGRVAVVFVIGRRGGLDAVRVADSSGNARLEEAALGAVRRVRFPQPPEGATVDQRSFRQDYRFK